VLLDRNVDKGLKLVRLASAGLLNSGGEARGRTSKLPGNISSNQLYTNRYSLSINP
jgi:hypothetical protein